MMTLFCNTDSYPTCDMMIDIMQGSLPGEPKKKFPILKNTHLSTISQKVFRKIARDERKYFVHGTFFLGNFSSSFSLVGTHVNSSKLTFIVFTR